MTLPTKALSNVCALTGEAVTDDIPSGHLCNAPLKVEGAVNERDQLRVRVKILEENNNGFADSISTILSREAAGVLAHDARVTELLNDMQMLEQRLLVTDEILTAKIGVEAGKALVEGRAAVVPLTLMGSACQLTTLDYDFPEGDSVLKYLNDIRLDKLTEG